MTTKEQLIVGRQVPVDLGDGLQVTMRKLKTSELLAFAELGASTPAEMAKAQQALLAKVIVEPELTEEDVGNLDADLYAKLVEAFRDANGLTSKAVEAVRDFP